MEKADSPSKATKKDRNFCGLVQSLLLLLRLPENAALCKPVYSASFA
jgi:hypothetical protein